MDTISLCKKLISFPSARSSKGLLGTVECDTAHFIEELFAKQNLNNIKIEKQSVTDDRYNLFIHDENPIQLLFIGHMDMVEVGTGWTKNPLGEEDEKNIYGRGSADMKSGNAVIINTIMSAFLNKQTGVAALFYCDEEYEFLGMKSFLQKNTKPETLQLVICPEPTNLGIREGVRGDIEYHISLKGKKGHAARPHTGINSFRALLAGVNALDALCEQKSNSLLGKPTVNIAGVHCGVLDGFDTNNKPILSCAGNVIPDYCEAVIEVRTIPEITDEEIQEIFTQEIKKYGAELTKIKKTFHVGSYSTERKSLKQIEVAQQKIIDRIYYDNAALGGYSDIQMIATAWNVPCILLGPSGTHMHGTDESVDKESILQLEKIYNEIIHQFSSQ